MLVRSGRRPSDQPADEVGEVCQQSGEEVAGGGGVHDHELHGGSFYQKGIRWLYSEFVCTHRFRKRDQHSHRRSFAVKEAVVEAEPEGNPLSLNTYHFRVLQRGQNFHPRVTIRVRSTGSFCCDEFSWGHVVLWDHTNELPHQYDT